MVRFPPALQKNKFTCRLLADFVASLLIGNNFKRYPDLKNVIDVKYLTTHKNPQSLSPPCFQGFSPRVKCEVEIFFSHKYKSVSCGPSVHRNKKIDSLQRRKAASFSACRPLFFNVYFRTKALKAFAARSMPVSGASGVFTKGATLLAQHFNLIFFAATV